MLAEHLANHAGLAHDQVNHASGQVDFFMHKTEQRYHGQGCFTGWFDDWGATSGQGSRQLFGNHADREVPGCNQPRHADGAIVNGPGAVFWLFGQGVGIQCLNMLGTVIKEASGVNGFTLRFLKRLAMLHAENSAHFFLVINQCVPDAFEPAAAGLERVRRTQAQGLLACIYGSVDVIRRHGRDLCDTVASRRVIHIKPVAIGCIRPASTDVTCKIFQ